jgi:hypothetical protein
VVKGSPERGLKGSTDSLGRGKEEKGKKTERMGVQKKGVLVFLFFLVFSLFSLALVVISWGDL